MRKTAHARALKERKSLMNALCSHVSSCENSRKRLSFEHELICCFFPDQSRLTQKFQPQSALVSLFFSNPNLADELSSAPPATRRSIICRHRHSRPHQLRRNCPGRSALRQILAEPNDIECKPLSSVLHLLLGHARPCTTTSQNPKSKINSAKPAHGAVQRLAALSSNQKSETINQKLP